MLRSSGSSPVPQDVSTKEKTLFIRDTAFYATPDSDYGKIYREVFREIPDRTTHPGFREIMAQWQARGGIDVRLYGNSQRYKDWSESDGIEYVHLSDLMNDMYVKDIFVNPEFFQSPLIIDVSEQTKPPKVAYAGWTPNSQKVRNADIVRVPRDLSKWLFDDPRDYYGFKAKVSVGSNVTVVLENPNGNVSEMDFFLCEEIHNSKENSLSAHSPLGSALLNRFPGDTFCYEAPGGLVKCKILWASPNPLGLYLDRIILSSLNIGKIYYKVSSMTKMHPELQWIEDFVKSLRERESSSCRINCRTCSDLSYTMCINNCMEKYDGCRYCTINKDSPLLCSLLLARSIELLERSCTICGYPLDHDGLCPKSDEHASYPARTIVVGTYRPYHAGAGRLLESLLSKMILGFKSNPCLVIPLGNLAVARLLIEKLPVDTVVTGVPAHPKDVESSGFDRVGLLCRWIAMNLGFRYEPNLIIKTRYQRARDDRDDSLFKCTEDLSKYNTVLLVDDVATTFSTLDRCAKSLRQSGVSQVIGCCLARTVGDNVWV